MNVSIEGYKPWPLTWRMPLYLREALDEIRKSDRTGGMYQLRFGETMPIVRDGIRYLAVKTYHGIHLYVPTDAQPSFAGEFRDWPRMLKQAPIGVGIAIGAAFGAIFGVPGVAVGALLGLAVDLKRRDPNQKGE